MKNLFKAFLTICLVIFLIGVGTNSFAGPTALRPIMGSGANEGKVVDWKSEEISTNVIPVGASDFPDVVGCFGYPEERYGLGVTPDMAGVNTEGWTAEDYVQFQTSYLGMETKPLQDYVGDFQFDLIDKVNRIRTRKVYQFVKPMYGKDGIRYKNMVYFYDPPDLKGMSIFLIKHSDPQKADDQWIYLSALRRVRRISSAQKMDSFAGTDTTNDQNDRAPETWNKKIIGEIYLSVDKPPINNCYGSEFHRGYIDGKHAVIVEMTPKNKDWWVSRELVYYGKECGTWLYEESYDKGGRLCLQLLPFMGHMYPKEPRYWTFGDWYAQDLRTQHKTKIYLNEKDRAGNTVLNFDADKRDWSEYVFFYDTGFSDVYVSQRFMQRGTR